VTIHSTTVGASYWVEFSENFDLHCHYLLERKLRSRNQELLPCCLEIVFDVLRYFVNIFMELLPYFTVKRNVDFLLGTHMVH